MQENKNIISAKSTNKIFSPHIGCAALSHN